MKIYIAGKVSKDSQFGTHHWRDTFTEELARLSGVELQQLDPLVYETGSYDPQHVFDKDCWLINQADCVIVYLSDDISVGGSQEMLIAKYLQKPLIGLAPRGGKFVRDEREFMGQIIRNYVDPFVFSTCDIVCETIDEVADVLQHLPDPAKSITIIDEAIKRYEKRER